MSSGLPPQSHLDQDALAGLLRAVPRREPSTALVSRLVAATRPAWPLPAGAWSLFGVRSELVVSAGVLAGAALLTLAPVVLVAAVFALDTGAAVRGLARACVLLVEWFSAGLSVWEVLGRIGRVTGAALASPAGTVLLLGGVLTAALALAGLSRVLPGKPGEL
jgi:hypothetical protein